jgi:hypothetical protein
MGGHDEKPSSQGTKSPEQPKGPSRAERKVNLPVALMREEGGRVMPLLGGKPQLIVKLLYGSGLCILETGARTATTRGFCDPALGPLTLRCHNYRTDPFIGSTLSLRCHNYRTDPFTTLSRSLATHSRV